MTYQNELAEIVNAVQREAQQAGLTADGYTQRVSDKAELAQECLQILWKFTRDRDARLFGEEVSPGQLRVMHSSLILHLDDLRHRLQALKSDPLSPVEAASALCDGIAQIESDTKKFWGKFDVSNCLPELQRRRIVKLGFAYPPEVPLNTLRKW